MPDPIANIYAPFDEWLDQVEALWGARIVDAEILDHAYASYLAGLNAWDAHVALWLSFQSDRAPPPPRGLRWVGATLIHPEHPLLRQGEVRPIEMALAFLAVALSVIVIIAATAS